MAAPPSGIGSEKSENAPGEVTNELGPVAVCFVIGGTKDFAGTGTGTIEQGSRDPVCLIVDPVGCSKYPEMIRTHKMRGAKIVILANQADLSRLTKEDAASADAILADDISAEALVRSLRRVCSGERIPSRDLIPSVPAQAATPHSRFAGRERELTIPEKEVLSGVVRGHSNKVIAWDLGMAEATVKIHLESLMRKINVQNRTEAAVWALTNRSAEDSPSRGFV